MKYPESLLNLIEFYKKLPGIGEKSAERMALATLNIKEGDLKVAADTIKNIKNVIHKCKICGNYTEKELCVICEDSSREKSLICIVEDYKSLVSFEKAGNFKGVFHILDGLISPMDGIGPEDIRINELKQRVNDLKNVELIIALRSSIEGETTTMYIKKIFENSNVVISRLSYGIPIGTEIDYLDILTLDKALEDRKKIS